jgi:hypothetical protein
MGFPLSFFIIKLNNTVFANFIAGKIQYWCIDGKYRIYVARHETVGKTRYR